MVLLSALGGLLAGCAAARTPAEARPIVVARKGYRVVPPPGWEPLTSTSADVALRKPALAAGLMAHATCDAKTARRPLPVLARHLRFGLKDVHDLDEEPVELAGHRGRRSRFSARLDGMAVAVGAVTLEERGCVFDLVVVAPPEHLRDAAEDFERFAASFALTDEAP